MSDERCDPCKKHRKTKCTDKNIIIHGELDVKCNTELERDLTVDGTVTFNGPSIVNGPETFNNTVTLNEQLIIKDPITISVPTLFGGADLSKPTIQEAIDYFAGRHAMNGTILVAKGRYVEALRVDKIASALSDQTETLPYNQTFSIVGDQRKWGGTTYLQDGFNANPLSIFPAFGPNLAKVTLVGGVGTVTVSLAPGPNPDFGAMGLVLGDVIKIRDNAGVWFEGTLSVTPAAGSNTLAYTSTPVGSIVVGGVGSALVLCPNVEVVCPVAGGTGIVISEASLNMEGLWFNSDSTHGAASPANLVRALGHGTNLNVSNCVFDNWTNTLSSSSMMFDQVRLIGGYAAPLIFAYVSTSNAIIRSPAQAMFLLGTNMLFGYWNIFDVPTSQAMFPERNSDLFLSQPLQIVNCGQGVRTFATSHSEVQRFKLVNCPTGFSSTSGCSTQLGIAGFNSEIDCGTAANSIGILGTINSHNQIRGPIKISASGAGAVGIMANRVGSNALETSVPTFVGIPDNLRYASENDSKFSASRSTFAPANVYTYTVAAPTVMENAFENQVLNNASAIALTLNPAGLGAGVSIYLGKKFTISSLTAAAHTLTLSGAFFKKFGNIPNPSTVATFGGVDSFLTILVESATSVRVLDSAGVILA